ncbi:MULTISPECIES: 3-hydroxyacyl-CoA dehydrogenase NAD-binding domain-containing protein [unclassified Sphingobium]|uniref:3-hydroxyacyl-CoA dehydrogenase NAD-binding domain-containing protein n=1 Tax=unclassified Sphingobium TaxID=2611147 RepID=UPI00222539E6|nr:MULTISPECIES: 3-hydroxyacyl-CoA dehydrogenase NAD-binding domain-containing protein [unclassified Sphingobium]MCW2412615.1 3-hydroxyacyl-CoA dehydrogenase/enoyl-CoA hydratase/3-hydroxybutyryl-CoA epimerase [Sphingobium sp. B8D3D]MCW2415088.1 3-hydroxyacyl-CoA dehydrogenase/enoyl-CoA hydratase/3-hydroxybutyryl-CoA epimerase [Sphingobium sp. B8D3A]
MATTITTEIDGDGIALLTIDVPGQSMNVITPDFLTDFAAAIARIGSEEAIKGAVVCSGKDSGFMAGMDLKYLSAMLREATTGDVDMAALFDNVFTLNDLLRKVETCGKPVAIAIEGTAMGGGLELALACHHRVLSNNPKVQIGLPEILVGLFPGGGGSQRLPRLIGIQGALMYMLQGKSWRPAEAAAMKVVDELADPGQTVDVAKAWVKANPDAHTQPWDIKGFKVPGGSGQFNPGFIQTMMAATVMTTKQTQRNIHAPHALLSAVYEGIQLPMDRAIRVESKYFAKVVADPQAGNMVRTLFVSKQAAERGARRPVGVEKAPTRKLAVLGAGMMGAGIANVAAQAGIDVVLLDRDLASADKGKAHAQAQMQKRIGRGMTPDKMEQALARITPADSVDALQGCDFVIEAVFEDPAIKAEITQRVESVLGPDVIFGSNTSTLPISGLAKAWSKPENFIGVHFFSPVEKMPLVEIILGKGTGDAAVAKALDFVAQIRKTPIVVNDSRGFYTSRCFGTYVQEGAQMLAEGINPALIENVGRQLGMPVGPLAVSDEVSIELAHKVTLAAKAALGDAYVPAKADDVVAHMVEIGRLGRKNGKGYYDYPADGGKKALWSGLAAEFPRALKQPTPAKVRERLLYRQLVECARCFAEGVLVTPQDGDIGAIFGWGFAPYTGGPFSAIDTIGPAKVVEVLDRLTAAHGERFAPPEQLREMAASGHGYYDRAQVEAA